MISSIAKYSTILLAVAGLVGILWIVSLQEKKQIPPSPLPRNPPAEKPYAHAVSATGILESLSENILVGVAVSGVVSEVLVKVGDHVSKGDVLFRVDDRELKAQQFTATAAREVAQANVLVVQAQRAKLETQLMRYQSVTDARAISREELDNRRQDTEVSKAQERVAQANLIAAEAELKRLELLVERHQISAPRDGTVIQLNVRVGEYASTVPKMPALVLGETDRFQVRADVDEQSACRIRSGQAGFASLKGQPNVKLPLEFIRIDPFVIPKVSLTGLGTERVDTRVLQVIYKVSRPEGVLMYAGQQVDVWIDAPENK